MTSTPANVKLQVVRNGGAPESGVVAAAFDDEVVLKLSSTNGVKKAKYRIYEYPEGFPCPAGWIAGSLAYEVTVKNGAPAPPITLPSSDPDLAGMYLLDVEVNDRTRSGAVVTDLYDDATLLEIPFTTAVLRDIPYLLGKQVDPKRGWAGPLKALIRYIDQVIITPGGTGDFIGPGSSTNDNLVSFSGATGKGGKDSGIASANVVSNYANVAALRAVAPTASRIVRTRAYSTANDGGGGTWRGVTGASAGTYVDDGGSVIVPTGGDGSAAWLDADPPGPRSVKRFGAINGPSSDNKAAILAALTACALSGMHATGGGETYGVSGNLSAPASTDLRDITLKQLTPDAAGDVRTLTSSSTDKIRLTRVIIDRNGDGTNGQLAYDAGIFISGGSGHHLEDVEVFGDDLGSGIVIQGCTDFKVVRPHCHDIAYNLGADPGDDRVQGLWINNCSRFRVVHPTMHDFNSDFGAGATTRYSTALRISGSSAFTVDDPFVYNADQGLDCSSSSGITRFRINGGHAMDCYTWGFKFANTAADGTITGAVAERCGFSGFVASGPTEASLTPLTANLLFVGCTAYDTASNGHWAGDDVSGFRVAKGTFDTDYPRGVRFVGCRAIDNQVSPTMRFGFYNEVDAATDGRYNECVNCISIGHTSRAFEKMNAPCVAVGRTATLSIPNNAWTTVDWNLDDDANGGAISPRRSAMHDTASNAETIYVRRAGRYRISAGVEFAANATGQRGIRLQYNGAVIPGTTVLVDAAASGTTALSVSIDKAFVGSSVRLLRVEVFQNSGGGLNITTGSGATFVQTSQDTGE